MIQGRRHPWKKIACVIYLFGACIEKHGGDEAAPILDSILLLIIYECVFLYIYLAIAFLSTVYLMMIIFYLFITQMIGTERCFYSVKPDIY